MKNAASLFSVVIYRKNERSAAYHEEYSLQSFSYFKRTVVKETLGFLSKMLVQNIDLEELPKELVHHMEEDEKGYKMFVKERGGMIYIVGTVLEYPSNTLSLFVEDIAKFIGEMGEKARIKEMEEEYMGAEDKKKFAEKRYEEDKGRLAKYLREQMGEYQDYAQKDIVTQIQDELGMVEEILKETIENALNRGGKIDELINSADSLSFQTKTLYRLSKKQNKRCCGIV